MFAAERDAERVQTLRREWREHICPSLVGRRTFFLDESGITTALTRLYGRAIGGERAVGTASKNYARQINVLSAINADGVAVSMAVEGSVNAAVMIVFVRDVLRSVLKTGDVIILDNFSVHKTRAVQAEFAAAGVEVYYLPPYSPDLNPIEHCWSKVKTYLRGVQARTHEKLYSEIGIALGKVTASDAKGWIKHCGYG
jgi:transposase